MGQSVLIEIGGNVAFLGASNCASIDITPHRDGTKMGTSDWEAASAYKWVVDQFSWRRTSNIRGDQSQLRVHRGPANIPSFLQTVVANYGPSTIRNETAEVDDTWCFVIEIIVLHDSKFAVCTFHADRTLEAQVVEGFNHRALGFPFQAALIP